MAEQELTKADQARAFLRKNPDAMLIDFVQETGIEMYSSQFSSIKKEIQGELKSKKAAATRKANKVKQNGAQTAKLEARITELEGEVAYRDWRHEGEKNGFVLRLLQEEAGAQT